MQKLVLLTFALVFVLLALVACAPSLAVPTPGPADWATPIPLTTRIPAPVVSTPIPSTVANQIRYDWAALYGVFLQGNMFIVWGDLGSYDGPEIAGQPDCPVDKKRGGITLNCEKKNVTRNGLLDINTKDAFPLCRSVTTKPSPSPTLIPADSAKSIFYALYQCRDFPTTNIMMYGMLIYQDLQEKGQACPSEGYFEGRGPWKLTICYPVIIQKPTTPTSTPFPRGEN